MDEDLDEEDLLMNIEKQIERNHESSQKDVDHLRDELLSIKIEIENLANRLQ
jgi:hypothetical protein